MASRTKKEKGNEPEGVKWLALAPAAAFLGRSPQTVASLAVSKVIRRERRTVTHLSVRPRWHYSLEDLVAYREKHGVPEWRTDGTGKYVTATDAAKLIGCSVSAVYAFASAGAIATKKRVEFTWPTKKTAAGYSFADVMAKRVFLQTQTSATTFEEETVIAQATVTSRRTLNSKEVTAVQVSALKRHIKSLQRFLKRMTKPK